MRQTLSPFCGSGAKGQLLGLLLAPCCSAPNPSFCIRHILSSLYLAGALQTARPRAPRQIAAHQFPQIQGGKWRRESQRKGKRRSFLLPSPQHQPCHCPRLQPLASVGTSTPCCRPPPPPGAAQVGSLLSWAECPACGAAPLSTSFLEASSLCWLSLGWVMPLPAPISTFASWVFFSLLASNTCTPNSRY